MSSNTNLVPFENKGVPAILANQGADIDDDLTEGVSGGFAVMSIKGSRWRIKYKGEEYPVVDANGDAVPSIEAVLLKSNAAISKNYYEEQYAEGSAEAPDCFSIDGITPDPSSKKLQHQKCASCPKNVFGSRMTPAGKKAKACADNRRMAIVPLGDLVNETFGGPMLLRVPAASLADLAQFGKTLKTRGFPYNAVAVRLGFDIDVAYPKLTFKAIRPLNDEEAAVVAEHLEGETVGRILATAGELEAPTEEAPPPPADDVFEQPQPAAAKPAAAVAKPTVVKTAPAAKPAAAAPAAKPTPAPAAAPAAKVAAFGGAGNKPAAAPAAKPAAAAKPRPAAKPTPAPAPAQQELLPPDDGGDGEDPTASNALDAEIDSILGDLDSIT